MKQLTVMDSLLNEEEAEYSPIMTIPFRDLKLVTERMDSIVTEVSTAQKELAQPAALLGRFIARRKNSFRKLSVFKYICKLNNALCRLLGLDINRVLENFRDLFSEYVDKESMEASLQKKFFCVRFVAIHKILQRINCCCFEASQDIVNLLQKGFFLEINTVLLAVVARIKNITLTHISLVAKFSKLLPVSFLPVGCELPEVKPQVNLTLSQSAKSTPFLTKPAIIINKSYQRKKGLFDMGAEVKRESVGSTLDIKMLNTLENVNKFINEEQKARTNGLTTCTTKSILNHEWKGAVKMFRRKIEASEYKKAFLMFQNFLRSKI